MGQFSKNSRITVTNEYGEIISPETLVMTPSTENIRLSDEEHYFLKIVAVRLFTLDRYSEKKVKVLYHYTSCSALQSILRGSKQKCTSPVLYFTRFDSLNDKDEKNDIIKFKQRYSQKKFESGEISQSFYDVLNDVSVSSKKIIPTERETDDINPLDSNEREQECDVYLCCFSKEDDLLPMWNYYSKSNHYEGYCIGFSNKSFQELRFKGNSFKLEVYKVIYSDEEKEKIFDSFFIPLAQDYDSGSDKQKEQIKQQISFFLADFQYLFKNKAFEHEKEMRAILYIPKNVNTSNMENDYISNIKYRDSHGYIVPYIEFTCPENSVVSVKTAPLLERELAIKNLSEYLEHLGYKDVIVDSSSIPIRF